MIYRILFLYTFLLTAQPYQALASSCHEAVSNTGNLQIEVIETSKGCDMLLSPMEENPSYRAYSFSQRGLIQIFNHYDFPGVTDATANGSRSFFIFPRKQIPTFKISGGSVRVTTSSGVSVDFSSGSQGSDAETSVAPHFENDASSALQMTETPEVNPTNGGGVSISLSPQAQVLVLDTGFSIGGVAFTQPSGVSTFMDSFGNKCALLNSDLFSFSDYDADLKFTTDSELYVYLKSTCPGLRTPQ